MTSMFTVQVSLPIYWSSQLQKQTTYSSTQLSSSSDITDDKNEIAKKFHSEEELQEFRKFLACEFSLENLLVKLPSVQDL